MFPHHATGLRGRHGRSPLFTLVVLAGLALGFAPAAAGDRSAGTADVLLARSALAALDADPQLRNANLVVSVVDRVAVVGGPVPTAEAGERAAWLVRNVRGIAEVKNRCFVQAGSDPLIRMVADRMGTTRPPVPELPPIAPGPRGGPVAAPPPAARETFSPSTPTPPPAREVVALKPVDSVLMAPVGPHGSVAPALTPPPARPAPAVVTGRPGEVLRAATAVRDANPKFTALTLEMRDGTLTIGGSAARAADAWELAQALRRVPGVARVAVGAVDVR